MQSLVPLSVLDLAVVAEGSTVGQALRNSIDLAVHAERLGYRRYWVAEHHNMPGIASSAPAVLLAHAAEHTTTIRLGSGGVMLPNHASLVVAEQFGMLEALHPGRVDLGLGRAPGTDQLTARALRRRLSATGDGGADEFPGQLVELLGYFTGQFPDEHPFASITATPGLGNEPVVWLLGSSTYSAQLAGMLGLPFSFAHHFAPEHTLDAVAAYRDRFEPSIYLDTPYVMLGASVIAAPDDREARRLALPGALSWVRLRYGRPGRMPSPDTAAEYTFTPSERAVANARLESQIIGGPEKVARELTELVTGTGADEVAITTMVHGHDDRVRSYELLAEAWGL